MENLVICVLSQLIDLEDPFNPEACNDHFYCPECIVEFVKDNLAKNVTSMNCREPGCCGVLDPEYCRPILPSEIYDRWGKALCEDVIMGSEKSTCSYFQCPFADCSVLLIHDVQDQNDEINQSQCPNCKRIVCTKCKVPWHNNFDCDQFQRLRY
ncbi:E3 ubiquitin-protein ligase RSL1-like [Argentina anserina]|uniref:E3 ubiquitin-protein ligase RSL1-like n=1 Tax=Argentina anserina TaxID=57926 RepID=UPI0021763483|nr:E3 ubiquitin-protein ligase RSL1-like [Potentilla anserina]